MPQGTLYGYHFLKLRLEAPMTEKKHLGSLPLGAHNHSTGTSKNNAVGVKLDVSRGLPDRGQA